MKRIKIVSGHYGSGKTEFSLNLAVGMKEKESLVSLIDLDIANPYFRSREVKDELAIRGIKVYANAYGYDITADLPAITSDIRMPLGNKKYQVVIDLGGDGSGARVLNQFSRFLKQGEFDFWFVVNANRPETETASEAISYMDMIKSETGLPFNGIINNTNLIRKTSMWDIEKGVKVCDEISKNTGVDFIYNVYAPEVMDEKMIGEIEGNFDKLFPIRLYMRPEWLDK